MTKPKSTHGGLREGAGRPPDSEEGPRVFLNTKVLPSTLTRVRHYALQYGSQGKFIDEAVDALVRSLNRR